MTSGELAQHGIRKVKEHPLGFDFSRALRLRFTVVWALMMREVHTRYGRENIGFLWLIGEPLLFCLGVILMWSAVKPPYEHGVPVVTFVMTGYVPLTLWRHSVFRAVRCFSANINLLYHRQVGIFDFLASRVVLEIYGALIAFAVIAFIFYVFGQYELPRDYAKFYLGWLLMILFSAGLAIILACLSEMVEWVERLVAPSTYLMVPLSGAFFMADWLPENFRNVVMYIPSVHAFELIRAGQFGPSVRVHYDIAYSVFISLALIAIGLILTRVVRRYIEVE